MGYLRRLDEVDRTQVDAVGGKGANLGELRRIDGVRVPDGFCITTDAFREVLAATPSADELLDRLTGLAEGDRDALRATSAELRQALEQAPPPRALIAELEAALLRDGEHAAHAVRSSATAEDRPDASFAGQHDSYLDVVGAAAIRAHVSRCWASLFTERAVGYRLRNGIDHRSVAMAVVVQRMVAPAAAGVLFTADPVTSNRTITAVEAVAGTGEALVSGLVSPDAYSVRADGTVTSTPAGGAAVLTAAQVLDLARLGRRVEAHFAQPQDVEWCLVGDHDLRIVQSRPITTLFPVPEAADDANRVYLSVGHQQMMTDAMKPLGLSVWHLTTPAVMTDAGGRLFIDVTERLAAPGTRRALLGVMGASDPLMRDALETVLERGFVALRDDGDAAAPGPATPPEPIPTDPAVVTALIERSETSLAALGRDLEGRSGPELFDHLRDAFQEDIRLLFDPQSIPVIMAGLDATTWLNDHLHEWLGETNAADVLAQSAPHNVTSQMGLALLDVADAIRPYPDVVALLERVAAGGPVGLDELGGVEGGAQAGAAIRDFLHRYGMRCAGEIDLTRPRWSEQPAALVATLLGNVRNAEPGAAARRFAQGRQRARDAEQQLVARVRALPDGSRKAEELTRMIDRLRTFIGYREYPKYNRVCRAFVHKRALLGEADRLVRAGVLREPEDIYYLRFDELNEVVRTRDVDRALIDRRKAAFESYRTLTPPRVLTSDGEALSGAYRRELPPGALAGLAVSSGTVEGRARVVVDFAQADLEPGDILVTTCTDPSWTPLFLAAGGLVTEVGGLMTHGAVIAREYGLPAVVGVPDATRLIRDGARIRVHGTAGFVEILDDPAHGHAG